MLYKDEFISNMLREILRQSHFHLQPRALQLSQANVDSYVTAYSWNVWKPHEWPFISHVSFFGSMWPHHWNGEFKETVKDKNIQNQLKDTKSKDILIISSSIFELSVVGWQIDSGSETGLLWGRQTRDYRQHSTVPSLMPSINTDSTIQRAWRDCHHYLLWCTSHRTPVTVQRCTLLENCTVDCAMTELSVIVVAELRGEDVSCQLVRFEFPACISIVK